MELNTLNDTLVIIDNQAAIPKKERDTSSFYKTEKDAIIKNLIEEAGEEVYEYIERFGFIHNTNLILLSSIRHYLYGSKDLMQVKTVVNLKLMNHITYLQHCLYEMNRFLPIGGSLVSCLNDYSGNKSKSKRYAASNPVSRSEMVMLNSYVNKTYSATPFFRWVYKIINLRGNRLLTTNKARTILEKKGFQVININEINGITFLISIKISNVKMRRFEVINLF